MSQRRLSFALPLLATVVLLPASWTNAGDPLRGWNDGPTKAAIVDFVRSVTNQNSKDYVKPENRIATFDNDGTLWCEKPLYIHLYANLGRFKELIETNPKLADKQPFKAMTSKDLDYFMDLMETGQIDTIVSDVFGVPFVGMTTDRFAKWNRDWLAKWKHPRFKVGYRQLTFRPMVELVAYLQANDFDVHIFTADEGAFVKLMATELYGIPSRNAHGSSIKLKYEVDGDQATLVRTAEANYLDNWDSKTRLIFQSIGKRPIFAAGNSNGDLHMLQYVSQQKGPSMSVLVHHNDAEREYAYNKHTDKVLPLAKKEGWTVIDMKNDWKMVFSSSK